MKKLLVILLIPIVFACIFYALLGFVYASFDITTYGRPEKAMAGSIWLIFSVALIAAALGAIGKNDNN